MEDKLFGLVCLIAIVQIILVLIMIAGLMFRLKKSSRVAVMVIGDIGRSPRMQNHALSLAQSGFLVDFIGLKGTQPCTEIMQNKNISLHYLRDPPSKMTGVASKIFLFYKALMQFIDILFHLLFRVDKCSHILVQNPPTIPNLAVSWIVCCIKGSSLIIDWHNYGYSILAMNLKSSTHPLIKFSKWFEGFFGSLSQANFCVTKAMQRDLKEKWDINASVLYDRATTRYKETETEDQHILFTTLTQEYSVLCGERPAANNVENFSAFTQKQFENAPQLRKDRPVLLISSTSWTEDEDFGILLSGLEEYESRKNADARLPKIVCVITGKGPQKDHYLQLIDKKNFEHVTIITPWLSADDYPRLIGSADLGVCLHTSSSGLDLPMKVVDMFSCGVPVCAIGFQCLEELVNEDVNGKMFNTPSQLADQLQDLLSGFPNDQRTLSRFKENLKYFRNSTWETQWNIVALPLFKQ